MLLNKKLIRMLLLIERNMYLSISSIVGFSPIVRLETLVRFIIRPLIQIFSKPMNKFMVVNRCFDNVFSLFFTNSYLLICNSLKNKYLQLLLKDVHFCYAQFAYFIRFSHVWSCTFLALKIESQFLFTGIVQKAQKN